MANKKTDDTSEVNVSILGKSSSSNSGTQSNVSDIYQANNLYGSDIIVPQMPPLTLCLMVQLSPTLNTLILSHAKNVHGLGYELVKPEYMKNEKDMPKEAEEERNQLRMFSMYCNPDKNLEMLREEICIDQESNGQGYMEVVRNLMGEIAELYHLPSHSVRMTVRDKEFTNYNERVRDLASGEYVEIPRRKRFRRYVQVINGIQKTYFKEFGDPRIIDVDTGKENKSAKKPATEVICFRVSSTSESSYAKPRWIGHFIDILGARTASEINYNFFENKTIPPIVVMVSGGHLTKKSREKLDDLFTKEIKGSDNFHKGIVIDAVPVQAEKSLDGDKMPTVRIDIKPLTQFIQDDALFQAYQKEITKGLMSVFQSNAIILGRSDDYTRATAREAMRVTEELMYVPERKKFDYIFNRTIISAMGIRYWDFKSLGLKTTDYSEIVKSIGAVKEAITIGTIMEAVANMLNKPMPDIPEEYKSITLGEMLNRQNPEAEETDYEEVIDEKKTPKDKKEKKQNVVKSLMSMRNDIKNILKEDGLKVTNFKEVA